MHAAADRPEFAPPPQPGLVRGLFAAVIAHLLLAAALTWGVQWKREAQDVSAEAELWASVPREAAPPPVVVAPPPAPAPAPAPAPREEPRPEPRPREADINLQREKDRREAQRRAEEEEERRERQRKATEAARKEAARQEAAKKEEARREEARKEAARVAAENRRKDDEKKRLEKAQAAKLEKERQARLERLQQMAGQGAEGSRGIAAQSSGPSGNWAGRVRARVKPNIVFTDDVAGNPEAVINVRLAPDGTIVGKRVVKSSGHRGWDDAVMRALDKTEVLPRDTDGRVPASVDLVFRPRD